MCNGFMLEEALRLKFKNVEGIEPSRKAINEQAKKLKIKLDMMYSTKLF